MKQNIRSGRVRRIVSAIAACVPLFSFAATYYVNPDPALASDEYDGTAAVWAGTGSLTGPKLTLQGAMRISGLKNGDIVRAAAGVYDRGGTHSDSLGSNRVVVAGGVRLIGAGADVTTVKGARGAGTDGLGAGAMRAVYLQTDAVVQGFTITGGATEGTADADKNRGGGVNGVRGLVADCRIEGNICGHRGVAVNGNTLLRCTIGENAGAGSYGVYNNVNLIDCVYDCSKPPYSAVKAYNCLFKKCVPQNSKTYPAPVYNSIVLAEQGWNTAFYNCRLVKGMRGSDNGVLNSDGRSQDGLAALASWYDQETYRPLPGSALIDAGDDGYYALATNGWNAIWLSLSGKDFAGRVRRFGSSVDIGPGEYDWLDGTVPGLTVEAEDLDGGTTRVVVTRDFLSERLCTGFTFGGTSVEFDRNGVGSVWTNLVPTVSRTDNALLPVFASSVTQWYVNPDPLKGSDANRGYHPDCPFLTLQHAADKAVSGDVIHAAPGVYRAGGKLVGETMTRVSLKSGVGLVSDSGPAATAIEGVLSSEPGMSGPDSVRCASVPSGAYVKGFTLRNGSTRVKSDSVYDENGGGVLGPGAAIDCVITNCCAVRGGASANATLIRCIVRDCRIAAGATNVSGQVANTGVEGMHYGYAYDSWIDSGVFNLTEIRNCRCANVWHNGDSGKRTRIYNSYVLSDYGFLTYSNCVHAAIKRDTCTADEKTVFNSPQTFDGLMRPPASDAATVDAGDNAHYVYPALFAHEAGKDIAGGQRVYNGAIDIGPGEFDYRGIFTAALRRKGVSVDAASAGVSVAADTALALGTGDTLRLAVAFKNGGVCSFTVAAADGASVTVTAGGVVLVPDGNVYSFSGKAASVRTVTVTCDAGSAAVSGFELPGGLVILLK